MVRIPRSPVRPPYRHRIECVLVRQVVAHRGGSSPQEVRRHSPPVLLWTRIQRGGDPRDATGPDSSGQFRDQDPYSEPDLKSRRLRLSAVNGSPSDDTPARSPRQDARSTLRTRRSGKSNPVRLVVLRIINIFVVPNAKRFCRVQILEILTYYKHRISPPLSTGEFSLFKRPIQAGITAVIMALLGFSPHISRGQPSTAAQVVTVTVAPIVVMAVFGEPSPFIFNETTELTRMTDESSYYNLSTNLGGVVILAEIDAPMPEGIRLFLSGESTLGTSRGPIDISRTTNAREIITSIKPGLENGRRLHYEFRVEESAGESPLQSRIVTLSVLNPMTGLATRMAQTIFFEVDRKEILSPGER